MGMYHLLSVAEDAMELNKDRRPEVESAIGKAVFRLCCDPQYGVLGSPKAERITWEDVLNCGAAVRHVKEMHSTDYGIFVFSRGALRPLRDLNEDEIKEFSEQVQRALADRAE